MNKIIKFTQDVINFNIEIESIIESFWKNINLSSEDIYKLTFGKKIKKFNELNIYRAKVECTEFHKFEDKHVSRKQILDFGSGVCYGEILNTLAPDNDPIDAFILVPYGQINLLGYSLDCLPLCMIKIEDDGEEDFKTILIPLTYLYYFVSVDRDTIFIRIQNAILSQINSIFKSHVTGKNMKILNLNNYIEAKEYIDKHILASEE